MRTAHTRTSHVRHCSTRMVELQMNIRLHLFRHSTSAVSGMQRSMWRHPCRVTPQGQPSTETMGGCSVPGRLSWISTRAWLFVRPLLIQILSTVCQSSPDFCTVNHGPATKWTPSIQSRVQRWCSPTRLTVPLVINGGKSVFSMSNTCRRSKGTRVGGMCVRTTPC